MWLNLIFSLVGGLGLFFVGIQMMASGMQKAAGDKLRRILEALTANPLVAVFTGIVVTILIQSSSTATVMVVGFVNAGIMTLSQAVATIIGSNIGTTLTAQIISFKIDFLALPAIGIGALLNFLGKRRLHKYIGQTILGFGLLFMGLMTMSAGMNPLKEMPAFQNMLVYFSDYPLLGVMAATVFTALIQNSGAVTVVIISLALQ
ncbi:MAG: Na/Pi cotransporter family protein, partial [Firmicutes bacterium]|nr:Na/Pi cotransporter family protein [Bacillota bacterium]